MLNSSIMQRSSLSARSQRPAAQRPVVESRRITVSVSARATATKPSASPADKTVLADVAKQFDRWNAALATLDPKKVAAL